MRACVHACIHAGGSRGRGSNVVRFKCHTTRWCYTPGYYYSTCLISKYVSYTARDDGGGYRERESEKEREERMQESKNVFESMHQFALWKHFEY